MNPTPTSTQTSRKPLRLLVVDDSEDDAILLVRELRRNGFAPDYERVCNAPAMKAALARQSWQFVISDYHMPNFDPFEALRILKQTGRDIPFILVSRVVDDRNAVAAMKAGAADFIMKQDLVRLVPAIERELRDAANRAGRRSAEDALRLSEEQLQQAQKLEAIGRLAGGVAHDFNNLLTVITGYSDRALRQLAADHPVRVPVEEIQKSAERATALTRQLLAFSRKQTLQPVVLDLNAVVANVEEMLRRLIGENIELHSTLSPKPCAVKADPGQIEQVIMNLAVNARDAMPMGGKLILETDVLTLESARNSGPHQFLPGDYVRLTVTDTGTGMTDEVKAHLFEPFFTTKEVGKGTGLGLATSYGIIKQSGGHILVYSEPGHGTCFKIYLPAAETIALPAPAQPAGASTTATSAPPCTETILLVEDEAALRELALCVLSECGYNVLAASNGKEGLEIAKNRNGHPIDLVLTDVIMPQMGGKEMIDQMRPLLPKAKVLFVSGYTDDALAHHGVLEPGISFLEKPFSPTRLIFKVREVLDAHPARVS